MDMIRAVLMFDFDGTLVDSKQAIATSMLYALDALNLPALPLATIYQGIGLPAPVAVARTMPDLDAATAARLVALYRQHYDQHGQFSHQPFDGVVQLLPRLKEAGYRLTIATAKQAAPLQQLLERYGWIEWFEATRGGDQVANSKPAPDMLFSLMQELDVAAGDCLMIGDTTYDMQMAKAAGVGSCAVSWGAHGVEALVAVEPDFIQHQVAGLRDWLLPV
jgi:phosphoglycolate phosphatase